MIREFECDVALASCAMLPEPDPDAMLLSDALETAGVSHRVWAWDDPSRNWSAARITVLRSTWNYPQHPEAFALWVESAARASALWNPAAAVRWNVHKRYLTWLAERDIAVVPTELVPRGSETRLTDIAAARGWTADDVVIKPAVSAASYRTIHAPIGSDSAEAHVRDLARTGDVIVQPYVRSVDTYGERALVWIDGELTHAVRKRRRFAGDEEAVSEAVAISPAEAELAERVLDVARAATGVPLLYARVDLAPDSNATPMLMELELIEPSLFLAQCPSALERFVEAIRSKLRR